MAKRGANLTFGGGKKIWGRKKPIKSDDLFLYLVGAPFEFSGRAPFKLVTPLNTNRTILTL